MAIVVFRWGDEVPYYFADLVPAGPTVLVFDPLEERGGEPIGERFRSLDPAVLDSDVVVFRSSSASAAVSIESDRIVSAIASDGFAVVHRSDDPESPGPRLRAVGDVELDESWLPLIREAELRSLLLRAGAVSSGDNAHYLLPSGWHADKFIRLGDALQSICDCRRLADWVLGSLQPDTDLLSDTGAMLPLLQEVQRFAVLKYGWPVKLDTVDEYPSVDSLTQSMEHLRTRSTRVGDGPHKILFVISVNSSGTALDRFNAVKSPGDRALVVCESGSIDSMRSDPLVHIPVSRWRPGADGECESCGSVARIPIDRRSYHKVADYEVKARKITPGIAGEAAAFFQLVSDADAAHLHYTSGRGTHYPVWIDTERLLAQPVVREAMASTVASHASGSEIVLIPDGPAATLLADIVAGVADLPVHTVDSSGRLPAGCEGDVGRSERVLVVDDAIVSGVTLTRLRRAIYNAGQKHGRNPQTVGVVLIARPRSEDQLQALRRPFRDADGVQLHSVYQAYLPGSGDCPWCREARLLRSALASGGSDHGAELVERLRRLEAEVVEPLFIGSDGRGMGLRTEDAFFGTLREVPAFAAASSAVLRALEDCRASGEAGIRYVIDVATAIDAFYDSVLLIGILRTCRKEHLRFATFDPGISERVARLSELGEALRPEVPCEIGWAIAAEVLPVDGFASLAAAHASSTMEFIQAYLRTRFPELHPDCDI